MQSEADLQYERYQALVARVRLLERLGNDLHYAALMRDDWFTLNTDPDTRLEAAIKAWENR